MSSRRAAEDLRGQHIDPRNVLQDGLFAGLIGGLSVIVVFLIHDALRGEPLKTPSVLGTLLFQGASAAQNVQPELTVSIAFNGIHILAWVIAGLVASYAVAIVEHYPKVWYLVFVAVTFLFAGFLYVEGAFEVPGLGRLQLWLGAVVGAGAMATFLGWAHPGALQHLDDIYED